jgi:signal peptidase I
VLGNFWTSAVFWTVITLALSPIIIVGVWFSLPKALNTEMFPLFVVVSPSMCIPKEDCSIFSHTFERTLHVGDLLVIQGVDAKDLKTDYPDSDIIVFRNPARAVNDAKANIVHRITDVVEVNGKLYFHTKGDGNGYPNVWPQEPQSVDPWYSNPNEDPYSTYDSAISEDYVYGKVVMRVPWIGAVAIKSQEYSIIPVILGVIIVLLILFEFMLPLIKKRVAQSKESVVVDVIEEQPSQDDNSLITDMSNQ